MIVRKPTQNTNGIVKRKKYKIDCSKKKKYKIVIVHKKESKRLLQFWNNKEWYKPTQNMNSKT